jgi:hypothetical protein
MTKEYACALFDYSDGKLFWKVNLTTRNYIGREAGSPAHGYKTVMVNGRNWRIHRLVYLMHYGYLPDVIDHINGDRSDNRIENLRDAGTVGNARNARMRSNNRTGVKGVSWDKNRDKWVVRVKANGRINQKYVSDFNTAAKVAAGMRQALHGEYANHG